MVPAEEKVDEELDGLLDRLVALAEDPIRREGPDEGPVADLGGVRLPQRSEELELPAESASRGPESEQAAAEGFFPVAPRSLAQAQVSEMVVEGIVLRSLAHEGSMRGVEISQRIGLPFAIIEKLLQGLKTRRLLMHKSGGGLADYIYELTEAGAVKVRQDPSPCKYCGAAPVSLADYEASVAAQSLTRLEVRPEDLKRAFGQMTLSDEMSKRLGLAIASGKGLFLYGRPGNGKTCIAERITAVYGTSIWIPRAISVGGEIIRLFDPGCHEELPLREGDQIISDERIDGRWVRIRRPTIVVGGELTMASLEITTEGDSGVAEGPVQLKSNCGTLVIDDFGRQQIAPAELLNRWIVPLEKRYDLLHLASGRKIRVPFDQFVVFSTNLEPKDLVDEAFLRRIPYKIEIENPSEDQFRGLFQGTCAKLGVEFHADALDYLLEAHYRQAKREMRFLSSARFAASGRDVLPVYELAAGREHNRAGHRGAKLLFDRRRLSPARRHLQSAIWATKRGRMAGAIALASPRGHSSASGSRRVRGLVGFLVRFRPAVCVSS